jgi:tetratricopeptide (TPR) repeat protein
MMPWIVTTALAAAAALSTPQDDEKKIRWGDSLDAAQQAALSKKRAIILYIQPRGEINPPPAFSDRRVVDSSGELALFVKVRFDEEHPTLIDLKIRSAPMLLAFDYHLNLYGAWQGAPASDRILDAVTKIPDWAAENRKQLRQNLNSAINLRDGGDTTGAVRMVSAVLNSNLKGFEEIRQAQLLLQSIADGVFKKIDALAAEGKRKEAVAQYRQAARTFGGTAYAVEAELRLGKVHLDAGDVQDAIQQAARARRTYARSNPDALVRIDEFIAQVTARGVAEIRRILEEGIRGDPTESKERIRALQKAYEGTDAAAHAADVLRDLES